MNPQVSMQNSVRFRCVHTMMHTSPNLNKRVVFWNGDEILSRALYDRTNMQPMIVAKIYGWTLWSK